MDKGEDSEWSAIGPRSPRYCRIRTQNPYSASCETGVRKDSVMKERIVVSGGSGFIGRLLTPKLVADDYDVIVLSRSHRATAEATRQVRWDGRTLGNWTEELDGARALSNLAGRSVNCRYNERNRREILDSRVDSTRVLGEAIARCNQAPRVWLNASTATIYKHTFARPMAG